jgi:predicted DNA-binding WGR domain protein
MTTKWCLVKASDGTRGAEGKKKVYEIVVDGTIVKVSWGMAEKPNRQTQTIYLDSPQSARQEAITKLVMKEAKGYTLAYSA